MSQPPCRYLSCPDLRCATKLSNWDLTCIGVARFCSGVLSKADLSTCHLALFRKTGMHTASTPEVQEKHQGFGSARRNITEYGLDPESFCGQAVGPESLFATPGPLAEDLQFCFDTMLAQGSDIARWRKKQWNILKTALTDVMSWADALLFGTLRVIHQGCKPPQTLFSRTDSFEHFVA